MIAYCHWHFHLSQIIIVIKLLLPRFIIQSIPSKKWSINGKYIIYFNHSDEISSPPQKIDLERNINIINSKIRVIISLRIKMWFIWKVGEKVWIDLPCVVIKIFRFNVKTRNKIGTQVLAKFFNPLFIWFTTHFQSYKNILVASFSLSNLFRVAILLSLPLSLIYNSFPFL